MDDEIAQLEREAAEARATLAALEARLGEKRKRLSDARAEAQALGRLRDPRAFMLKTRDAGRLEALHFVRSLPRAHLMKIFAALLRCAREDLSFEEPDVWFTPIDAASPLFGEICALTGLGEETLIRRDFVVDAAAIGQINNGWRIDWHAKHYVEYVVEHAFETCKRAHRVNALCLCVSDVGPNLDIQWSLATEED